MRKIAQCLYGSHLYGTQTIDSDIDYKGLFMPETKDILLGRMPRTSDRQEGKIDSQWHSLHHFVQLACQGQTMAIEMLYSNLVEVHDEYIWDGLIFKSRAFSIKEYESVYWLCPRSGFEVFSKGRTTCEN